MITTQLETIESGLPELKNLLPLHYAELALDQDKVPLSPQYDVYVARERAGQTIYMTVRRDGELIGYFIGFICPGLHYSTCLTCTMDIFYIKKEDRGATLLGIRLFRAVEQELIRRGVQRWFVGSKVKADASALFERLKFSKVETFYSKWIGG